MRAVQITRFGGPEVLDVVDLPDPVPGDGQQLYDVCSAGINFADTHQIENSYLAQQKLPLIPGAEFVGTPVGGGQRVVGLLEGGGYAEKVVAHDLAHLAGARRRHRRAGAGRRPPGRDRLAPAAHQRAPGRGRVRRRHRRRRRRRLASPSSWPAAGAPAGSSPPPPARRSARSPRSSARDATVDPALADDDPKTFTAALREANGGKRVDIVLEMTGGNVFDGSLSALAPVRPAGRLRHGRPGAAEAGPGAVADGHQPRGHRVLAGPLHEPARR